MPRDNIQNMDFNLSGEPLDRINIRSLECCGWLEVSKFYCHYGDPDPHYLKEIENLSLGNTLIIPNDNWSNVEDEETQFAMFCVITGEQEKVWKESLSKLGWEKTISFKNPNSGNVCNQWIFIPKELKV